MAPGRGRGSDPRQTEANSPPARPRIEPVAPPLAAASVSRAPEFLPAFLRIRPAPADARRNRSSNRRPLSASDRFASLPARPSAQARSQPLPKQPAQTGDFEAFPAPSSRDRLLFYAPFIPCRPFPPRQII